MGVERETRLACDSGDGQHFITRALGECGERTPPLYVAVPEGPPRLASERVADGERRFEVHYVPLVCGAHHHAWNFPLWQGFCGGGGAGVAALARGKRVVLRATQPNVPECARQSRSLVTEAAFPPGLLTNVFADNTTTTRLIGHVPDLASVLYTGAGGRFAVGLGCAGAANIKKVRARSLGGNDMPGFSWTACR